MQKLLEGVHRFQQREFGRYREVFRRLSREQMTTIVDIQLKLFEKRLSRRGLGLTISAQAKDFLVEQGWDPQYGARPLKRAIQRYVEDELAKKILGGELQQGDVVAIGKSGDALTFGKAQLN